MNSLTSNTNMDTLTSTQVKTSVITRTKLLVATAVLLASGGLAFILVPMVTAKPDMSFPTLPAPRYSLTEGKLIFSWQNSGNAPAKFPFGKPIFRVEAGNARGTAVGTPVFFTAESLDRNSVTYPAGKITAVSFSYTPPADATKLLITLDPNSLINESNEANNTVRVNLPLADLVFSPTSNPTFSANTLVFTWGNQGTAPARFLAGQPIYKAEAIDAVGAVIGSPVSSSAGSGGSTYTAGSMSATSLPFVAPAGAVKIRITLDQTNLITESNENNNAYLLDLPLPDMAFTASLMPSYVTVGNNGSLFYSWSNIGNAPIVYTGREMAITLEKLDNAGSLLSRSHFPIVNGSSDGGSYPSGYNSQQHGYAWPEEAAKIRIILDFFNSFTESNELNNVYLVERPVVTSTPPITPTSTPFSCTDTDGGANRDVFGEVHVISGGNSTGIADGCFSTLVVAEAVCVPTSTLGFATLTLRCASDKVCSFGACTIMASSTTPTPTSTPPEATSTPPS